MFLAALTAHTQVQASMAQLCTACLPAQASMPLAVYVVGVVFGTEKLTLATTGNLLVVGVGILIASYGECCMLQAIAREAVRVSAAGCLVKACT
jgi:hypothetical protein